MPAAASSTGQGIAWTVVLTFIFGSAVSAAATGQPETYPKMAALEQYLIASRDAETALARSAAPSSVSDGARILVLGKSGYETVAAGSNGFTCLVERGWMSPFDSTNFWNPKLRGPVCYNPAASRSVLPYTLFRTKLVMGGTTSKAQLLEQVQTAVAQKKLLPPEVGSMSYMMSKNAYLSDENDHAWHSHLMFHIAKTEAAAWGANLPGSPVIVDDGDTQVPEPQTIFMVAVGHWSDGTAAAPHAH
jgi:hypothetical protein